jgi:hypothetical protein
MGMIANSDRWQPYDLAYQAVDLDFLGAGAEGWGTFPFFCSTLDVLGWCAISLFTLRG